MLHLFHGKHKEHGDDSYLENDFFGILVQYHGKKKKGTRYLHPQIDTNHNTIKYYAFDSHKQKDLFLELLKIQWIGWKNGYILACHDPKKLKEAIEDFDVKYFTSLPGIWPKTAKRILLEMKTNLGKEDVKKMSINSKLLQDIVSSLHDLWYERKQVKNLLPDYPWKLTKNELPEIMKRLVEHL